MVPPSKKLKITHQPDIDLEDISTNKASELSLKERICLAREWLAQNPWEKSVTAARIYNIAPTTFKSACKRATSSTSGQGAGGYNKILSKEELDAIHRFIRSLLECGTETNFSVVYAAICAIKRRHDPDYKGPSKTWFLNFWKQNQLHKIKTKPLAVIRITAQDEKLVEKWMQKYRYDLKTLGIKRKNILNFDETGVRIGCAKGHDILVPLDVLEVWSYLPIVG